MTAGRGRCHRGAGAVQALALPRGGGRSSRAMAVGPDLVDELLARPDDLALRLVIADRLQDAGDPRGELVAVQCALAAAPPPAPEERERLAEREAALVGRALPELDPAAVELEWHLGFVLAAAVLDRAIELVPALLAHPAARLI